MMTRMSRIGMCFCMALALAAPSAAAPKPTFDPAAPSFVDINRLLGEYQKTKAYLKYEQKVREQSKKFTQEMELLVKVRHCTPMERQEALALSEKPKLDKKEQARFDELVKKSDEIEKELVTLGQKEKPSDEDAKRIAEISKMRQDAVRFIAKEEADRRDRTRDYRVQLLTEVEDELLALVTQLAKDRKIPVVYSRQAVLVGGNDLTDDIVKKLPK